MSAWQEDIDNDECSGDFWNNPENEYYKNNMSLNPRDIVDSAEGWDSELTQWFWIKIAEPNDIMAITTRDGAIVFNEDLINSYIQ